MDLKPENFGNKLEIQDSQKQKGNLLKRTWPLFTAIIMVVILLLGLKTAWTSGKGEAQSKLVIANVKELQEALNFFYNDQDRFPTTSEFKDRNIMIQYLNQFPPNNFITRVCSQSFAYKRTSKNNYTLSFCLPKKEGNLKQGWNQVTFSK